MTKMEIRQRWSFSDVPNEVPERCLRMHYAGGLSIVIAEERGNAHKHRDAVRSNICRCRSRIRAIVNGAIVEPCYSVVLRNYSTKSQNMSEIDDSVGLSDYLERIQHLLMLIFMIISSHFMQRIPC